jgi:hypothetical protein
MDQFANTVIDRLGGTTAVAKLCECKPPSVHQWRTDGIPKYRLQFLRLARPDVFADLIEQGAEKSAA